MTLLAPDELDPRPYYVYVFGRLGGPFKIGHSFDPKQRAKDISFDAKGSRLTGGNGILWYTAKFPTQHDAYIIEQFTHDLLSERRMKAHPRFFMGHHPNEEWFSAPLPLAIRAINRAIRLKTSGRRPPKTPYPRQYVSTEFSEELMKLVNAYRLVPSKRLLPPKVRTLNAAICQLIKLGLNHSQYEADRATEPHD